MAEVYKAYQSSLDRYVAIKLLHPFLADDPEFKDRFEREARNVAKLRHPHIVQVYDFDTDAESESYYMVMELIEGETLKDRLTKLSDTRLPLSEVLRIIREATEALSYAHARGMIHRDVKPANLMLDSDGRVVLTDFGIAKIVTGNQQLTASGGMVGTPAYMAPEQGLGEAGDERSDIYSLGVILYQLMTGRLPFDADSPLALILKHMNEDIPSPRQFNPDISPAMEEIIYKAMAKDPEERFQTADEMLAQLNALALAEEQGTPPPTMTGSGRGGDGNRRTTGVFPAIAEPAPPIRTGSRTPWAGIAGIAVVALIGLLGLTTMTTGKIPLLGIAIRPSETFTPSPTPTSLPTNTPTSIPTNTPTNLPTNTATLTYTPSNTATFTATNTATATATYTASITPTPTASNTATPTITNTPTATATFTPSDTATPSITPTATNSATATPNITATIRAATDVAQNATATSVQQTLQAFFQTQQVRVSNTPDYTQTAILCVKDYRLFSQKPGSKDPIKANTEFSAEITLRNTSNCDWLPGAYLSYKSGELFGAARKITMKNTEPVKPGEDAVFIFAGRTPKKGGQYSGAWEVRLAGDILIDAPLTISFFAYE